MSTSVRAYHHGDLRAALIGAAIESLEAGEAFSMRGIARRAGVSPTAPYRHFADREALESAVAVEGFRDLRADLSDAVVRVPEGAGAERVIAELGIAYVAFALRRPAVFRLMFGHECDPADSERVRAAEQLHEVLNTVLLGVLGADDASSLSTALWATAHGLAFLHLDGKLRPEPTADVDARVRSSVRAIFSAGAAKHPTPRDPGEPETRP